MIDVSNLKDALETLGFVAHGDIHEKVFPEIGCSLKVDFHAKKLVYPNEIKGRERNNGFDKKENFYYFFTTFEVAFHHQCYGPAYANAPAHRPENRQCRRQNPTLARQVAD